MDPPPAEDSRRRAPGRGSAAGRGNARSRLGLKRTSVTAASPPPGSSAAPPRVPPPLPISAPAAPTATPAAPSSSSAAPSSSSAAPTSTVPPRPQQGAVWGAIPPNFASLPGNPQGQNPWGYPPGGFLNFMQQPHYPPQPQVQGENFHLVGQTMSFNPISQSPSSAHGTATPEAAKQETSSLLDMLINAECALLLWGLYRILSGDPGIVACDSSYLEEAGCKDFVEAIYSSEKLPMLSRVRQCTWCKANIRGYDHHCPAFGTCIGQKNHRLFMALLTGFVVAESTYTMCSTKYITRCISSGTIRLENPVSLNMVISTMLFSILQVLWQIVFLMWHIYCICFNIKTDEWINWKKYPEFQMKEQPRSDSEVKFVNPYDKGMLCNIREFLKPE